MSGSSRPSARSSASCERVADASQTLYGSQMRAVRLQSRYQPLLEAIPTIGQVAILAFGGWLALHHEITLGTFLAFSTYIVQLVAPARQLAGVLTIGQQARAGDRADLPAARPAAGHRRCRPTPSSCRRCEGAITFADVHFAYGDGAPGPAGLRPPHRRRASGWPSSVRAGAASRPSAMLVPRFYDPDRGRRARRRARRPRGHAGIAAPPDRRRLRGELPLLRHGAGQHRLRHARTPPTRRSRRPPGWPRPTSSSSSCPAATTPSSASAASPSRAVSASASPWPGPSCPTPAS